MVDEERLDEIDRQLLFRKYFQEASLLLDEISTSHSRAEALSVATFLMLAQIRKEVRRIGP